MTQTEYTSKINDLQIDLLFFASYGIVWDACHELFCVFGDFYVSGMQDAEVTKSL